MLAASAVLPLPAGRTAESARHFPIPHPVGRWSLPPAPDAPPPNARSTARSCNGAPRVGVARSQVSAGQPARVRRSRCVRARRVPAPARGRWRECACSSFQHSGATAGEFERTVAAQQLHHLFDDPGERQAQAVRQLTAHQRARGGDVLQGQLGQEGALQASLRERRRWGGQCGTRRPERRSGRVATGVSSPGVAGAGPLPPVTHGAAPISAGARHAVGCAARPLTAPTMPRVASFPRSAASASAASPLVPRSLAPWRAGVAGASSGR